jgi:hypothetical protein
MKSLLPVFTLLLIASCNESPTDRQRAKPPQVEQEYILGGNTEGSKYLISQSHRNSNTADDVKLLSNYDEALLLRAGSVYPGHYRNTPEVKSDHDNRSAVISRPQTVCGTTQADILGRIADCKDKNLAKAFQQGKKFGNMGEGNWQLVSKTATGTAGFEVWMDMRTQLVWSDRLEANNWCKASSNLENAAGVDCSVNTLFYCDADNLFSDAKGKLDGLVDWRLPTRNDLLQADINGSKVVLMNTNHDYWSATVDSTNNAKAWAVHGETGVLSSKSRNDDSISIRCVGRILK